MYIFAKPYIETMLKKEVKTYCPSSQQDWRQWLEKNHASEQSIWLVYYRTATNIPSLSWSAAVDEALCFGWIDSTKKTLDKERYMQYFSKRKPQSNWSKVNKEKIVKLVESKQMRKSGLASIEVAKKNGSWTFLDAVEELLLPEDLREALEKHKNALTYYEGLSNSIKKQLLYWVISAKRKETRGKRVLEIALSASEKLKPKEFR